MAGVAPAPCIGGGFLLVSDPSRGSPRDLGWGQMSRHRVWCAGRGAGSTVTLEQADQGAEGSCRFFGLAVGGGLPLQSGKRSRTRLSLGTWACHCSLSKVTLLPAKASFLLWALPAASGRRGEAGLGEVERFIPGEQAASADATLPTGVTAVPVSAVRGVGWPR